MQATKWKVSVIWKGILLFAVLAPASLCSQSIIGEPVYGLTGIVQTVAEIEALGLKNDPLRATMQVTKLREELSARKFRKPVQNPNALVTPKDQGFTLGNQALQSTQTIHSNFAATHSHETPGLVISPPDCMGDVSATQVCVASNNRVKWFTKPTVCDAPLTTSTTSGNNVLGTAVANFYLDDFFNSVRAGQEVTDPHVHYDRLTQRWFIVAINKAPASNRILIAMSSGPTITAQSSFTFFQFAHDQGAPAGSVDAGEFCDYPTLGVDKNALYIAGLIFNGQTEVYKGTSIYVVRKSALISNSLVMTPFRNVGNTTSNIFCAQGVQNDDPNATLGYYVGVDASSFGVLRYIVVQNPGGTPSISQSSVNVQSTAYPEDVPALGSTKPLDGGDDRLLNAVMNTHKLTGEKAIWTSHNVLVNASGVAASTGDRNGTRWYKLIANGTNLTVGQVGTLFDATAARRSYWMGSIGASGQDHAAVGSSVAGPQHHANAVVAGRYSQTPTGSLYPPVNATTFTETYNQETDDTQRWGDYSQTVVDPSDDMTLWTFQEYTSATNRWAVRAIQLKAPPPAPVAAMSAVQCTGNRISTVTINGTAGTGFAGYFDPGPDAGGPGFSKRLSLTSTGGVQVRNVTVVNPTQLRVELDYSAATLGSNQTLTITNPDCQSVTHAYALPADCSAPVTVTLQAVVEPASQLVRFSLPQTGGELLIYDAAGRLMMRERPSTTIYSVNGKRLARGIYFVRYQLANGDGLETRFALL